MYLTSIIVKKYNTFQEVFNHEIKKRKSLTSAS